VLTGVLEDEARSGDEVLNRLRGEHLGRSRSGPDAGTDCDGESAHIVAVELDLTRVQTGSHLEPERPHVLDDRARSRRRGPARTRA
jgi:hypothetical protein